VEAQFFIDLNIDNNRSDIFIAPAFMAMLFTNYNHEIKNIDLFRDQIRHDGNGENLAKGNKWITAGQNRASGNGAVCGSQRSDIREWNGGLQRTNGDESEGSRNALSDERILLPFTLRSHALSLTKS